MKILPTIQVLNHSNYDKNLSDLEVIKFIKNAVFQMEEKCKRIIIKNIIGELYILSTNFSKNQLHIDCMLITQQT